MRLEVAGVRLRAVEEGRPGSDRRDVDARGRSRGAARAGCRGRPRRSVAKTHGGRGVHGPSAGWPAAGAHPEVNATGIGGRPVRGSDVVADRRARRGSAPSAARYRRSGRADARAGMAGRAAVARPPRSRSGSPTAPRAPRIRTTSRQAASELAAASPRSFRARMPRATALASIGEPCGAHRAALERTRRSVRAAVAAVAVDRPPERRQRLEQRPTRGRHPVPCARRARTRRPVDRLRPDAETVRGVAVAAVEGASDGGAVGRVLVGARSRRSLARRAWAPVRRARRSVARMFAPARSSSSSAGRTAHRASRRRARRRAR